VDYRAGQVWFWAPRRERQPGASFQNCAVQAASLRLRVPADDKPKLRSVAERRGGGTQTGFKHGRSTGPSRGEPRLVALLQARQRRARDSAKTAWSPEGKQGFAVHSAQPGRGNESITLRQNPGPVTGPWVASTCGWGNGRGPWSCFNRRRGSWQRPSPSDARAELR